MVRLVFNGNGSNKTSWFTKERLKSSPYTDIINKTQNFFSIRGDQQFLSSFNLDRNFFINNEAYIGCLRDPGWLVVISGNTDVCVWGKGNYIRIKYAMRTTVGVWVLPCK